MEFIPLETSERNEKEPVKVSGKTTGRIIKPKENSNEILKRKKGKPRTKIIEVKNVKNKYRDNLELKRKLKIQKLKSLKKNEKKNEFEEEKDDAVVELEQKEVDSSKTEEDNQELNSEEEAFKKKCKELDEKKKNRLFLKLKKKIHSEAQIKELHPEIKKVIFPRKKNSRWCWAVFASEEKADEAMKKLIKNKDIFVNKPNPYERVMLKREKKMKVVRRRKEIKQKLLQMWM